MYSVPNLKSDENSQRRVAEEAAKIVAQIRAEKAQGKTHRSDTGRFNNSNFGGGF